MKIEPLDARTRLGIVQSIASGRMQPLPTVRDDFGRDISQSPVHLRSQSAAQAYLAQQQPAQAVAPVTPAAITPRAPAFSGGMFAGVSTMASSAAQSAPAAEFSSPQTYDNARDPRADVAKPSYQSTTVYPTK